MGDVLSESETINRSAVPLEGGPGELNPAVELARDAEFVLIGEASHGTDEFYRLRAALTRRLIEEHGFDAVAVEGDWPDVYRIHRFLHGAGNDPNAEAALGAFDRFPRWMWRNEAVRDFVAWLGDRNRAQRPDARTGFYGLDLYSLYRSADHVVRYLADVHPEAADRARERYACLGHHGDPQRYGHGAALGVSKDCEAEVVAQLQELLHGRGDQLRNDGLVDGEEGFFAEVNARLVRNAEAYYRGMFSSRVNTWNLRDEHMTEVLYRLAEHLGACRGRRARIVVWAHNSHLGDARATDRARYGELNLGQLVRERSGSRSVTIGFTTDRGHVTAARDWDGPAEHRRVRPALDGSVERLLADTEHERFFLRLAREAPPVLRKRALERAIGVIYRPETERQSHYFGTRLAEQFDAVLHLDDTRALVPLDVDDRWRAKETPDTWPFGY